MAKDTKKAAPGKPGRSHPWAVWNPGSLKRDPANATAVGRGHAEARKAGRIR